MTFNAELRTAPPPGPCPGQIPTSRAHAERCRACGKCNAIIAALVQNGEWSGQDFEQNARRPEPASH